jgi:hypothetical protein
MAKKPNYTPPPSGPSTTVSDVFAGFLDGTARFAFWTGILLVVGCVGLLLFTYSSVQSGSGVNLEQAKFNIEIYNKILLVGVIGMFVGSTYMFWGEETLPVIQLLTSALLFFGPQFVPAVIAPGSTPNAAGERAMASISTAGAILGLCSVISLIVDLSIRARERISIGAKADQMKYGKGVKEERDIQNVFMGKCWQLPFCRKFVRERCPIYHARRTCWKEQTGCMCEEEVIRGAMEGKVIPKDSVAASTYIPHNNKLTVAQKFERCKQCVIYNEHQKHKYKLALPMMIAGFVLLYVALRPILLSATQGLLIGLDRVVGNVTFGVSGGASRQIENSAIPLPEIVLVCLIIVLFTYCLKLLEFAIFKLKV